MMRRIVLCLFLAFVHPIKAQLRPTINLAFVFRAGNALTSIADLPALERTIATALAVNAQNALRFWSFAPTNGSGYLEIAAVKDGLSDDAAWLLEARLMINGVQNGRPLQGQLFKPSDFSIARPTEATWLGFVQRAFSEEFLTVRIEEFKALLSRLPLGRGLVLTDRPPASVVSVVLPLDWQIYRGFARSEFRIDCDSTNGVVSLYCVGVEKDFQFTPQQPRFRGLMASVTHREHAKQKKPLIPDDVQEFPALTPKALYVMTIEESSDLSDASNP